MQNTSINRGPIPNTSQPNYFPNRNQNSRAHSSQTYSNVSKFNYFQQAIIYNQYKTNYYKAINIKIDALIRDFKAIFMGLDIKYKFIFSDLFPGRLDKIFTLACDDPIKREESLINFCNSIVFSIDIILNSPLLERLSKLIIFFKKTNIKFTYDDLMYINNCKHYFKSILDVILIYLNKAATSDTAILYPHNSDSDSFLELAKSVATKSSVKIAQLNRIYEKVLKLYAQCPSNKDQTRSYINFCILFLILNKTN